MQDIDISFDEEGKVRVFPAADFEHSQQLQENSAEFMRGFPAFSVLSRDFTGFLPSIHALS